jgi:5-methylcytosine-specific restriction endonuclease McrA
MSWNTAKILPADKVFSVLIRSKAKKCMMCGKPGTGDDGIFGLQASHYFSRRKWNVRYDRENVDVLCISCHKKTHENKGMYEEFKIKQLGQKGFDLLTLRVNCRSQLGSNFWKNMTEKQAKKVFKV